MDREILIDLLKNISFEIGDSNNESNVSLSKNLTFFFLQKLTENINGYSTDEDIYNSIIDGSRDRGIDAVYFNDLSENNKTTAYIVQTKYTDSENKITIDEKEATRFIDNFNQFPYISGEMCKKLSTSQKEYIQLERSGVDIEKVGIVITLGRTSKVARKNLESNNIEIYEFDRINSEILLDEYLPNIEVKLYDNPSVYNGELQGILVISDMLRKTLIRECIKDNSLFAYNIRGIMNTRKNSIFKSIKETCKISPKSLFRVNNGINIVCENFEKKEDGVYFLERASVINGQQTVRAVTDVIDTLEKSVELCVPVKILKINPKSENKKKELIYLSQSANRQNIIKCSDLYANEEEQKMIALTSKKLDEQLRFIYIYKREFGKENYKTNVITKEEVAKIVNAFLWLNPNDRVEDLFRNHYKNIFYGLKAEDIALIKMLKQHIEVLFQRNDENSNNKFISNCAYVKFRKDRTINYSIYLFALLLSEVFGYKKTEDRKKLLCNIYVKMKENKAFNIEELFNADFWQIFIAICIRMLNQKYHNTEITSDYVRKPLDDKKSFISLYNEIDNELAFSKKVEPKILI